MKKQKCLKLGSKMPYLGIFYQNGLFGYFWARILKTVSSYLKSAPSNFANCKFCEKTKIPKFGTKNALFENFRTGIWKQYCHIWNQHLRISIIAKFDEKTKMPIFVTKKLCLGILYQKCLIWIFLGQNLKKTIVIFEISTSKLA